METEEQGFSPTVKLKEKWNGAKPKKNPESDPQMNHEHSTNQEGKLRTKRNWIRLEFKRHQAGRAIPGHPHPTQERPQLGSASSQERQEQDPLSSQCRRQCKSRKAPTFRRNPNPSSAGTRPGEWVLWSRGARARGWKSGVGGRDGEILEEISAVVAATLYTTTV